MNQKILAILVAGIILAAGYVLIAHQDGEQNVAAIQNVSD